MKDNLAKSQKMGNQTTLVRELDINKKKKKKKKKKTFLGSRVIIILRLVSAFTHRESV